MALSLSIPPCIENPQHPFHPPPLGYPLRIHIQGLLVSVQKLLPDVDWTIESRFDCRSFLPAAPLLAKLTFQAAYGRALNEDEEIIVRDEYLGWVGQPWEKP